MSVKEKCFYDVKKTLFVQNEAVELILKYSKRSKKVTVQLNNNEPFHIYHQKYKKNQIMRDESNTKWCKYVEKKIKKEINKSSYKKSYIITLCQGYSVDDLDTSNINIHVKKTLQLKSKMVFAYLTHKDMIKLKNKNSNKICEVQTDSYVNTPEQNGYPSFVQSNSFSATSTLIPCSGRIQDLDADNSRRAIGQQNQITFTFPQEVNGIYNPNVVYLFIFDTGIARHRYLSINENRSRNYVRNNNGSVDPNDWFDRNGHGTHVAGTAASTIHGIAATTFNGNPNANQVISIKVLPDNGSGGLASWCIEAQNDVIQFARQHRDANIVVNMSLGANGGSNNIMNNPRYYDSPDRIVVVCAAGNRDSDVALSNFQPANSPGSIVVGNSAGTVTRRCNSNFGPRVDFFAPGTNIRSTWLNNQFNVLSGTSMAAPSLAGVATFILAHNNILGNSLNINVRRNRKTIFAILRCLSRTLSCIVPNALSIPVNLCNQDPRMTNTTRLILNMEGLGTLFLLHRWGLSQCQFN